MSEIVNIVYVELDEHGWINKEHCLHYYNW